MARSSACGVVVRRVGRAVAAAAACWCSTRQAHATPGFPSCWCCANAQQPDDRSQVAEAAVQSHGWFARRQWGCTTHADTPAHSRSRAKITRRQRPDISLGVCPSCAGHCHATAAAAAADKDQKLPHARPRTTIAVPQPNTWAAFTSFTSALHSTSRPARGHRPWHQQ